MDGERQNVPRCQGPPRAKFFVLKLAALPWRDFLDHVFWTEANPPAWVMDHIARPSQNVMRAASLAHTPMGVLSRGVSGIAGRTLIVNFPGNPPALTQLFPIVAPTLAHADQTLSRTGGRAAGA